MQYGQPRHPIEFGGPDLGLPHTCSPTKAPTMQQLVVAPARRRPAGMCWHSSREKNPRCTVETAAPTHLFI